MPKILSAKDVRLFIPLDERDKAEEERVGYFLRTPKVMDRSRFQRRIVDAGARPPQAAEFRRCARQGVKRIYRDAGRVDEAVAVLAFLAEYEAAEAILLQHPDEETAKEVVEDLAPEIEELERVLVREQYSPWTGLLGDKLHYQEVARMEAIRLFVVDGQNLDGDLKPAGRDGTLTLDQLELIPKRHLTELATEAQMALGLSEAERKN
jgi:hypothetical protein